MTDATDATDATAGTGPPPGTSAGRPLGVQEEHMPYTVDLGPARDAFGASVAAFVDAVDSCDGALLGSSRCHGWSRLDLVAHVIAGWQEMLGGFAVVTGDQPTVDAASYWTAFAGAHVESDPVAVLMAQRRQGAVYGFLAIWAVENAVHHLDLGLGEPSAGATGLPRDALAMARRTVEALAGPLPSQWSDALAVLVGTGRLPVPDDAPDAAALRSRLPAFS